MSWGSVAGLLVACAIAYRIGRERGRCQGQALGRALTPITLRVEALDEGWCPLCGRAAVDKDVAFPAEWGRGEESTDENRRRRSCSGQGA